MWLFRSTVVTLLRGRAFEAEERLADRHALSLLDQQMRDSALAIDRHSGIQWFHHGKSSMPVDALAQRPENYAFHFQNRSFDNFFVVQVLGSDFEHHTRFPTVDDDVGDGLKIETIAEVTMSPVYIMRLSRVVGVDVDKIKEWRKQRESAVHVTPEIRSAIDKGNSDAVDLWFRMLP